MTLTTLSVLSFRDWLISLSTMPSKFIHVVACVRISFLYELNVTAYLCHILLIYSSVSGHLGCFSISAVGNNAAVNMDVQISLRDPAFSSFGYMHALPKVELLGRMVIPFLIFGGTAILFSVVAALFYIPANSAQGFHFSISSPTLVIFSFLDNSHPNGCESILFCFLNKSFPDCIHGF